jgi:hypothetical protein
MIQENQWNVLKKYLIKTADHHAGCTFQDFLKISTIFCFTANTWGYFKASELKTSDNV